MSEWEDRLKRVLGQEVEEELPKEPTFLKELKATPPSPPTVPQGRFTLDREALLRKPSKRREQSTPDYTFNYAGSSSRIQFALSMPYGHQYIPGSLRLYVVGSISDGSTVTFEVKEEGGNLITSYPKAASAGSITYRFDNRAQRTIMIIGIDFYVGLLPFTSLIDVQAIYDCEEPPLDGLL